MDLGHLMLTLVDADGRGWMGLGMHSLWGQGISFGVNQPCTRK
ncbi:unnamed protein product [Brassica rapa]|uniref:Uncharacterized protein n=1 Tax=Brassica campestris TaxID=3711 RepID=A0A3P6BUU0_BRACM|nr:unnamed protein product [Brassica rapa]VDD05460.1 unnamed protein product [Brassica rapa]